MRRFLTLVSVSLLTACGNDATTPSAADAVEELRSDQIIYDLSLVMSTDGIRRALVNGDTAYMAQSGSEVELIGVRLIFYDEMGRQSGTLTSETGDFDWRMRTMIARGNAVLRTQGPEGERILETEELHFDVNADRLWSAVPVVLRDGERDLKGTSFESDGQFQNFTVHSPETSPQDVGGSEGGIRF
jgi:LPS export ABC transporter protein LptC